MDSTFWAQFIIKTEDVVFGLLIPPRIPENPPSSPECPLVNHGSHLRNLIGNEIFGFRLEAHGLVEPT